MIASVLDSWAIIGWLQGEEPARAKVRELLEQASRGETRVGILLINVGEVTTKIPRLRYPALLARFLNSQRMVGCPRLSAT